MKKRDSEETQYWLSYSDMMAGLLLIFVIIIAVSMLRAQTHLEMQQNSLAEQQELLEEQQEIMNQQQEQIDRIIGVRSKIIEELMRAFENTNLSIKIDEQTGDIVLDSNILFDRGKYELKESGKEFLEQFMPIYIGTLIQPDFKEYVAEIIIEGYTDPDGGYIYNLELSQNRSLSVASYVLDDDSNIFTDIDLDSLREIITATGKSYNNLILDSNGEVDKPSSRRVEIKFKLRDTEMIKEMQKILNKEY